MATGISNPFRSHLKKAFWPNLGVGRSYQILKIPDVFLRFDIRGRLDLEPKSIFEMASIGHIIRKPGSNPGRLEMPIYEYHCNHCGHDFEELTFSTSGPAPDCPQCNHSDVVKLMSAGAFRPNGVPSGSGGFAPPACKRPHGSG